LSGTFDGASVRILKASEALRTEVRRCAISVERPVPE
jgi:hypothetical protein